MTEHKTATREEWLAARLELLEAEKALTRRSDELARQRQELPWVRIDKEYRFDTDEGTASLADLFGTLAAPHLSLHVRARLHGRVPVLLGDRGRLRRLRRPPRESRRHARRGVAGSAGETAGVQAADGLELPLGVVVRQRLQLRLPGGGSPRSNGSREPSSTTSTPRTFGRRPARTAPGSTSSHRARWERTGRPTGEKGLGSVHSCSRMASCTTPTRRTRVGWTASGACTSGSTAPHSVATRTASGGAATTSTTANDPDRRRAERATTGDCCSSSGRPRSALGNCHSNLTIDPRPGSPGAVRLASHWDTRSDLSGPVPGTSLVPRPVRDTESIRHVLFGSVASGTLWSWLPIRSSCARPA